MGGLSSLYVFLLCTFLFQVNGNVVLNSLKRMAKEVKTNVQQEMTAASVEARETARNVLTGLSQSVKTSEAWLDNEISNRINAIEASCKPNALEAKTMAKESLWSCLEMARVVSDGVNIVSGGFEAASGILETLDNFLQSLTACIIGPMQSVNQEVACYLSAIGTIATGVAQNIEQVEQYKNIVKRDVDDINSAIALCRNETLVHVVKKVTANCHI